MSSLHCAEYVLFGIALYLFCLRLEYKADGWLRAPELIIFAAVFAIGWPLMLGLIAYERFRSRNDGGAR